MLIAPPGAGKTGCPGHAGIDPARQTRSPVVTRDIDLFKRIEEHGSRVQVNMTVAAPLALDGEKARMAFEPACPPNRASLKAITEVQASGVQICITIPPCF